MAISPSKLVKIFLVIVLFAMLTAQGLLLSSRYIYQQGVKHTLDNAWDQALVSFDQAENIIPDWLGQYYAAWDLYRINLAAGKILKQLGQTYLIAEEVNPPKAFSAYLSARTRLELAERIDPVTYEVAFNQAQVETSLEMIYTTLYPRKHPPYDPEPLYRKAVQLRPNGINVLYSYAIFLAYIVDEGKLGSVVRRMTETFPSVYGKLKKEYFWSQTLMSQAEVGLKNALEKGISLREAHQSLADIYSENGAYSQAVSEYQASLDIRSFTNRYHNYIHMGKLHYLAGNIDKSDSWFMKGLQAATDFKSTLDSIYYFFLNNDQLSEFIRFATGIEEKLFNSPELDFAISQAWMNQKNYSLAKARLLRITADDQYAEAYYLLAKIAQQEQDWDQMELMAQKATALDKENSLYFYIFSVALQRQKRYSQAEDAATKALEKSQDGKFWLFNLRAWTRWAQYKYEAAALDWKRAFKLKPDNSGFPYQIAQCYERIARFEEAQAYVKKALSLSPDNASYQKLERRLK
nr:tetratricopeptide repeat protein [uncultured Desulfobacter sp.]